MNIYLCIFFLVILKEILVLLLRFSTKKEKKENNFPCKLRHFVTALSVGGTVDEERLFLLICTEKNIRKGRNPTLMLQRLTCHFDEFTSQFKAQDNARSWLVAFQNGSESGQIKQPQSEFTGWWLKFLPFPGNGSSPESNQGLRVCRSLGELRRR